MAENLKKPRARSKEKKEEQFREIMNVGRDLFIKKGPTGFKMRELAEILGMQQSNLYNYVQSKRELFYAIIQDDHNNFREAMKKTIREHKGNQIDCLIKLAEYYFNLAMTNPNMVRMMFSTPAPPSKKIGPFERDFDPHSSFYVLRDVVKKAIEEDELREIDIELFSHYVWSVVHGGTVVARNYAADHSEDFDAAREKFHEFLITQITNQLKYFYKKIEFS